MIDRWHANVRGGAVGTSTISSQAHTGPGDATMFRLAIMLTLLACFVGANITRAADPLDVIPQNAAGAIVVRNPKELGKKGDRFIAETDIKMPLRPSQLVDQLYTFLGITTGLDAEGTVALLVAEAESIGAEEVSKNILELIVVAVPFTDRDAMADNFGIKKDDL